MFDRPKYHLGDQYASALLAPVCMSLRELEARLLHYVERLQLSDADQAALEHALAIMARTLGEMEHIRGEGIPRPACSEAAQVEAADAPEGKV